MRQPLTVAPHSRRRLEERLGLRFPGVLALVDRLVWRLPPRSRLRRAAFGRAARLALEAHNRGDFEAAVARYDSQVELISDSRLVQLRFDRVYRGRDERVRFRATARRRNRPRRDRPHRTRRFQGHRSEDPTKPATAVPMMSTGRPRRGGLPRSEPGELTLTSLRPVPTPQYPATVRLCALRLDRDRA